MKIFPRYFSPYLKAQKNATDLISSAGITVENILFNWVNSIIKKQINDYSSYIYCAGSKDAKFNNISIRVKESISQERRKAIVNIKQEEELKKKEELENNSLEPRISMGDRCELLFDHSK